MRLLRCSLIPVLNASIEARSVPCFSFHVDMDFPRLCKLLHLSDMHIVGVERTGHFCLSATKTHPEVSCVGVAPGALIWLEQKSFPQRGDRV